MAKEKGATACREFLTGGERAEPVVRVADGSPRGGSWRAVIETALIALGLGLQFALVTHLSIQDDKARYSALDQLLGSGVISTTKYSLIGPLFSAPLWYFGKVVGSSYVWVVRFNDILLALAVIAFYFLLRRFMRSQALRTFLLLLVAASMFPGHTRLYYAEVFTALFAGIGLPLAVFGGQRGRFGGWALAVVGVANIPATVVGLGAAAVRFADTLRHKRLRYGLAVVAAVALSRGGSVDSARLAIQLRLCHRPRRSHHHAVFGTSPVSATRSSSAYLPELLSFGKGLLFFAPGMFLPIRRYLFELHNVTGAKLYHLYLLWMAFTVGLIFVYARWWAWYGGWFWGPRFLLFASIPACFVLAMRLSSQGATLGANMLTLVALALSCWVGIDGATFANQTHSGCLYVESLPARVPLPLRAGVQRLVASLRGFQQPDLPR